MPRPKLPRANAVADFQSARVENNIHKIRDKRDQVGVSYDDDSKRLTVVFRDSTLAGGLHTMDLSAWLTRPSLAVPFARALYSYGTDKQPLTRNDTRDSLTDLLKFLPLYEQACHSVVSCLADVSQDCVEAYFEHVGKKRNKKGETVKQTTVSAYMVPLRGVFKKLRNIEHEGYQIPRDVSVPTLGYSNRAGSIEHVSPLDDITVVRVVVGAMLELEALALAKPIPGFPIDVKGRIRDDLTHKDAVRLLEESESASPDSLTVRELIPFVIMLDLTTDFNSSNLLCAPLSDIKKHHNLYGKSRWEISVRKWRAGGAMQQRTFSVEQYSWANPVYQVAALEVYGKKLRTEVPLEESDRLFVGVNQNGCASTLYARHYGAKKAFKSALRAFCKENDIKPFALNQLRPTGSDVVHEISEGDVVKQKTALQHATSSLDLTSSTYTSPAAMRRDQERLARAMVWREAFIRSKGKIDATSAFGNPKRAPRSATPGFACFDIFDSPLPGQVQGAPCTAYCLCPSCPTASCNVHDDFSVARVIQVEKTLIAARSTVEPTRWTTLYAPQLESIKEEWLPRVPKAVLTRAAKLSLPDIPSVE
ncbi:hypothetical protein [Paraburkholderia bryophila]|uniref:Phage integrase family protein n=1 Tax=Paraburkholderia bryophila TaxID=420952 RepID=A0A7Y9WQ08_9BURK|nr:hypothetical protein [Paraburkholderia bryophila]NYH24240.1 hypothetical protein [Paraburkholderia bryophila]